MFATNIDAETTDEKVQAFTVHIQLHSPCFSWHCLIT